MMQSVYIKIKLTRTLPIDPIHGCEAGVEFNAKYRDTYINDEGVECRKNSRDSPVEFAGADGSLCVAFAHEYEVAN